MVGMWRPCIRITRRLQADVAVKIATWNVNGVRARAGQLAEWMAVEQPDVVCLQEIKAAPDQVPSLVLDLDEYWSHWHGVKGYSGVSVHVRKPKAAGSPHGAAPAPAVPATFAIPPFDFEQRILTTDVSFGGRPVTVASVYVPNGGKDFDAKLRFLQDLIAFAADHQRNARALVICGDLNVAHTERDVHPKERKGAAIGQRPEERALFDRLLAHGLVDLARVMDPDNDQLFSWWPPWRNMRQRNIGWRIDYVLASADLCRAARSCGVRASVGTSDHAPVVAEFAAPGS